MNTSTQNKVEEFLTDVQLLSPEQYEILNSVRDLFVRASDNVSEEIKYGGLVFLLSDTLFGGVFAYKNHVSVEFSKGTSFDDPDGLLQGNGMHRRHLKLNRIRDIDNMNLSYFIDQAISGA